MEVIAAMFVVAFAMLPIYYLIVLWHGIGFWLLIAAIIVIFALHLRKVYRNAKLG